MVAVGASVPFLVCGMPKSGTTFLQRMLDLHPEISCPSEQNFAFLERAFREVAERYGQVLAAVDQRTGGQGLTAFPAGLSTAMLTAVLPVLSRALARGRRIHGLNDNSVFDSPQLFDDGLGQPKIVAIIRNLVDLALSAWRHNHRLAEEEPHLAEKHLATLANPKNSVEGYVERLAPLYAHRVEQFLAYAQGRANIHIVLYEHLTALKRHQLGRIFAFLGASQEPGILDAVVAGSSREAMASTSARPEFFGLAEREKRQVTVDRAFRERMLAASITPRLQRLGYSVEGLMVGY